MSPAQKVQLFLLHFAGGNCYSFQFLKPYVPAHMEFHPLELPGRGKRMAEKRLDDEPGAIEDYLRQVKALRNNAPCLIYGHSMGAILGLRIAKRLEESGDAPVALIVSGNAGPGTGEKTCRSGMEDEELKNELRKLGGVPEEVLVNKELYDFFIPIMKADFRVLENGEELGPDFRISAPIIAMMGDSEETVEDIENWGRFTSNSFKHHLLSGNHFFIHDQPAKVVKIISSCYDRSLVSKHK